MTTGKQAFDGNTSVVIFESILNRQPVPSHQLNPDLPPQFERILERSLEKDRELRYQSAAEMRAKMKILKRTLDSQRTAAAQGSPVSNSGATAASPAIPPRVAKRGGNRAYADSGRSYGAAGRFSPRLVSPCREQPDGTASLSPVDLPAGNDSLRALYAQRAIRRLRRSLGGQADRAVYHQSGESPVAFAPAPGRRTDEHLFNQRYSVADQRECDRHLYTQTGTWLACLSTEATRAKFSDGVQWADWSPDGKQLAIVRDMGGKNRLEFPIGKVIHETPGWISNPRVSPDGERVAFIEHPQLGDDSGGVHVINRQGTDKILADNFLTVEGLAWAPDGKEIWYTGSTNVGNGRSLNAVTLSGRDRIIARVPAALQLEDISQNGKVLLSRQSWRRELSGLIAGMSKEQDFSWLRLFLSRRDCARWQAPPLRRRRSGRRRQATLSTAQDR